MLYRHNYINFGYSFLQSLADLFEIKTFEGEQKGRPSRLVGSWCKGEVKIIKQQLINDFSQKDSWFHKYKDSQFKYKHKNDDGAETGEQEQIQEFFSDPFNPSLRLKLLKYRCKTHMQVCALFS